MPDRNTQWIIGVVLAFGVVLVTQNAGINTRLEHVESDLRALRTEVRADLRALRTEVRADLRALDARLRAVEVGFGKVDQRLATIERVVLPANQARRRPGGTGAPAPPASARIR